MKNTQGYLWLLGAVCVAAIVVVAALLPGARFSFLLPAIAVCGAIPLWAFSRCPFRSSAGMAVLMAGYTLVACGVILNIHYYTVVCGGTYSHPVLHNNDALTDWSRAVNMLDGDALPDDIMSLRYITYVTYWLMLLFGRDIGVPLMFNALCYPFAIMLIGGIAWELTRNRSVSTVTMLVATLMCYLMAQATVYIKDVPLTMCVAAVVLVMVRWTRRQGVRPSDLWLLVPGMIGVAFLRANFMLMLLLGVVIMAVGERRWCDARFIGLAAACVVAFVAMHTLFSFPAVEDNIGVARDSGVFNHPQKVHAWDNMLGDDYEDMSVWRRLMWLPASVVVQFLIPFPWNFLRDTVYGPTMVVAHFGYFWYYAVAVLLYWIFACSKRSPRAMCLLVIWGVLLTLATAYMMSGRVSRYCLPYLPMFLPAVGLTLVSCLRRRSLWIWLGVFTVMLVPVLIVCHHLQMTAP